MEKRLKELKFSKDQEIKRLYEENGELKRREERG
jgi:hypothetical protein